MRRGCIDIGPNMASLELANVCLKLLERIAKIEFALSEWKSEVLPLN